ncbi:sedoheptulose-1,7-bisphosphatase [Delitschia confertaspora ATCC 74209]|uniref:Sedoheptulose-1,7-bisphosphatase n=1 Tax=Delitschia confertaspora ATCC 74209 TaxID=1513339 RepID=A0A9P4JKN1_9PLEO|nr:sedoheptulose-1,7-bisphosphatase [Delitschia confertaspora ATCC 74209]
MQDIASYLEGVIKADNRTELCKSVIPGLIGAINSISNVLQNSHEVSLVGTANAFGDDQLNVDVEAESVIRSAITKCPAIITASSEEDPVERTVAHVNQEGSNDNYSSKEKYTVAFDPLDGSSIIAPNWAVGTIIGIWEGDTALNQMPSSSQIASILGVYGPRTTVIVAVRIPGQTPILFEAGLEADKPKDFHVIRPEIKFSDPPYPTRYFAPANLRYAAESEAYMNLINHYIKEKYTLRYAGGLVPDVVHMLVKGHGVFVSPVGAGKAKLRRLYELCPIALIMECAMGVATDPVTGTQILSKPVADCDERGGLICGNLEEGKFAIKELAPLSKP